MTADPALTWFLQDAKRLGLTLSEYERRFGVILYEEGPLLGPTAHRIARGEVSGGAMDDGDFAIAQHKEKRRALTRRESRDVLPPNDCD
jgi:hypothetical protein